MSIFKKPKAGETWIYKQNNPWRNWKAEILDVQDGYVLFRHINEAHSMHKEAYAVNVFKSIYKYEPEME